MVKGNAAAMRCRGGGITVADRCNRSSSRSSSQSSLQSSNDSSSTIGRRLYRYIHTKYNGLKQLVKKTFSSSKSKQINNAQIELSENTENLEVESLEAQRLATEAETKRVEAHRKLDEEFKLLMSATPFIKFVSMTEITESIFVNTEEKRSFRDDKGMPFLDNEGNPILDVMGTAFQTDDKIECYGMYSPCPSGTNDNKFIFFVFDEETSMIKQIDFGVSGPGKYNLHPLGTAGAMLFNDDGTYNIIEKSIAFFDIGCGKNNTYDDESDEIDDEEY